MVGNHGKEGVGREICFGGGGSGDHMYGTPY